MSHGVNDQVGPAWRRIEQLEEIIAAVDAEREACAELAESSHQEPLPFTGSTKMRDFRKRCGAALAATIRARGPGEGHGMSMNWEQKYFLEDIEAAVEAEREECAKICDEFEGAYLAAARIRSRNQHPVALERREPSGEQKEEENG